MLKIKFTILLIFFSINIFSQHANSPYPIIFVHGITSDYTAWEKGTPSVKDFLEGNGLNFGGVINVTLDYVRSNITLNNTKEEDVHLFTEGVSNGDFYFLNFAVHSSGYSTKDNSNYPYDMNITYSPMLDIGNNVPVYGKLGEYRIGDIIRIDSELMRINEVYSSYLVVSRAILGTSTSTHLNPSKIYNLSNESNQASIAKQSLGLSLAINLIEQLTNSSKIIIVGHSMGGLCAREYIRSDYYRNNIAKLITIGTPHLGAKPDDINDWILLQRKLDSKSDAMRDLRYNYQENTGENPSPPFGDYPDNGIYLFGGMESAIPNDYYSKDVNSNGIIDNYSLTGLSTTLSSLNPNIDYTWVVSDAILGLGGGGDLCVRFQRQYPWDESGRQIGDTIKIYDKHWDETKNMYNIIRGLDEPDNKNLSYQLEFNNKINAFITFQTNYSSIDTDFYKIVVPEPGILTLNFSGLLGQRFLFLKDNQVLHTQILTTNTYTLQQDLNSGSYYIAIIGNATSTTHLNPYSILPTIVATPEPVINLELGDVNPKNGYDNTNFNFSVIYKSNFGTAPDQNSVKVHIINNNSYELIGNGTNWQEGVTFTKSINNFSAGQYQYYFSATVDGQIRRYPEGNNNLSFTVALNSIGWDLRVSELTNSPSTLTPGQVFTASAKVHNNSNSPDKIYHNIPYEFIFYNSSGGIEATYLDIIDQIDQGITKTITKDFTAPNQQGNCRVVFNLSVPVDENTANNSLSKQIIVSTVGPQKQWFINGTDAWVNLNSSTQSYTFMNDIYKLTFANNDYINLQQGNLSPNRINRLNFRMYNSQSVAVINEECSNQQAWISFGSDNPGLVTFDQTNITANAGSRIEFIAHCNNYVFSSTDPDIYLNNNGVTVEQWADGFTRFENNHSIKFYFAIPSNISPGTYSFYMASRLNNDDSKFLRQLSITIIAPPPSITSISKNTLSADDTLTIFGNNFGSNQGVIKFGSLSCASILNWANTQIKCIVPVGVMSGSLIVNNATGTSNELSYTVLSSTGNPIILQNILDFTIYAGETKTIANLNSLFIDPNGFPLLYTFYSQNNILLEEVDSLSKGILIVQGINSNLSSDKIYITVKDITNKTVIDTVVVTILNLPTPYNFHAEVTSGNVKLANLNWQYNSDNEQGFVIERKLGDTLSNNPYYIIKTLPYNSISYIDSSISIATTYSYRVAANNAFILSPYSNQSFIDVPVPVNLETFTSQFDNNKININWITASENNNKGFELQRKMEGEVWETILFIEGKGTTTEKTYYSYIDNFESKVYEGNLYYRLKQLDFDGVYSYSNEIKMEVSFIPKDYKLSQNYPNPFNPTTIIKYDIPLLSRVKISIYNILGEKIMDIVNTIQNIGYYKVNFDGSKYPSGVYFYTFDAQSIQKGKHLNETKKMLLIK